MAKTCQPRSKRCHKTAVQDLTLSVKQGEILGFLGPNGAGKTTSVKMLLSLIKPTAGTAVIPDLLALVGLADEAGVKLQTFSKGMLQRIGLAQALINDPALVFLDEPTSGLDPLGRRLVRDIINHLRAEGTAVFLNSHLLSEVEKTCDRVAFIRDGSVIETLSLAEFGQDSLQVTVRVGQPTPQLLEQLTHFGANVHLNRAHGRIHLTLQQESQLPQMAQGLIDQNHTLYELTPAPLSLEDRFLQIVGDSETTRPPDAETT